jgi:hypothetical protein
MFLISRPTTWVKLRDVSFGSVKVKRKYFRQLLDTERPNGNCEAMEETAGEFLIVFIDILQHTLIRFVQCLW